MAKPTYVQQDNRRMRIAPEAGWLKGFTFAHQTNVARDRLNNRDAIAVLLYRCGTMTTAELRDAMMTWRFGEASYEQREVTDWSRRYGGSGRPATTTRWFARQGFGSWFNLYYKHCGESFGDKGGDVYHHGFTDWSVGDVAFNTGKVLRESWTSFRRFFWYRSSPGQYTLTLEGWIRITELVAKGMVD